MPERFAGLRVVRIDERRDLLIEYVAWRTNVGLVLRRLEAIGGIGEGTPYLMDLLDDERDIVGDRPLTRAGVQYLRNRGFLVRKNPDA